MKSPRYHNIKRMDFLKKRKDDKRKGIWPLRHFRTFINKMGTILFISKRAHIYTQNIERGKMSGCESCYINALREARCTQNKKSNSKESRSAGRSTCWPQGAASAQGCRGETTAVSALSWPGKCKLGEATDFSPGFEKAPT